MFKGGVAVDGNGTGGGLRAQQAHSVLEKSQLVPQEAKSLAVGVDTTQVTGGEGFAKVPSRIHHLPQYTNYRHRRASDKHPDGNVMKHTKEIEIEGDRGRE